MAPNLGFYQLCGPHPKITILLTYYLCCVRNVVGGCGVDVPLDGLWRQNHTSFYGSDLEQNSNFVHGSDTIPHSIRWGGFSFLANVGGF